MSNCKVCKGKGYHKLSCPNNDNKQVKIGVVMLPDGYPIDKEIELFDEHYTNHVTTKKALGEIYRPRELKIVDNQHGGFKIVDPSIEAYMLATMLEFNPINSDIPLHEAKEFAEYLIGCYNSQRPHRKVNIENDLI